MEYFFGPEAGKWNVTYKVIDELGQMLAKQKVCNSVFDALPRPGFVDKDYFRRQLRGIVTRLKGNSYSLCKFSLSIGWRKHIYNVSIGTAG